MKKYDAFGELHPATVFIYFALVLGFTAVLRHPVAEAVSFAGAVAYAAVCEGKNAVVFSLRFAFPLAVITALINPLFNHSGETVLFSLPGGSSLTLESILYGLSAGGMLASSLMWFKNVSRVCTGEKVSYLFGKAAPTLSLLLSMSVRFVPMFKIRLDEIKEAQRGVSGDTDGGNVFMQMKRGVGIFSVLITRSFEDAIETADSMKSRGYGLDERSSFSVFGFSPRDRAALCFILFCGAFAAAGYAAGGFMFSFYPNIKSAPLSAITVCIQAVYCAICVFPAAINITEAKKWTALHSEM